MFVFFIFEWTDPLSCSLIVYCISACNLTLDLGANTREFSKTPITVIQAKKSQDSFWGGEQDGSWLFSKGISLAWPSWAEPSFEWLTLYLFCAYNNRISQAAQCPFTLVLSQITRLTFPLLFSVAWKKKSPGFLHNHRRQCWGMCAVIRQAMGDRYGKGSGGHALIHIETHTACSQRAVPDPTLCRSY